MDRNTITGLVLVAAILLGFSWYSSNQEKRYKEEKRITDSVAMAEGRLLNKTEQVELPPLEVPRQDADVLADAGVDSVRRARIGDDLFVAEKGEEEFFTVESDLLKLTFSNKGGRVNGVELKDYKTYYDKSLNLYEEGSAYFDMAFFIGNQYVNTGDFYFRYAGTETMDLPDNKRGQRVLMQLPVDSLSYLQYVYTIIDGEYMVDFDVEFVNMENSLSNQQSMLKFAWGSVAPQQEKGFKNENNYSTLVYKPSGDANVDDLGRSDGSKSTTVSGNLQWIAFKQQFYSSVFIAKQNFMNAELGYETATPTSGNIKKFHAEATVPFDKTQTQYNFQFYYGPNKYSLLKAYDLDLDKLVSLGGWMVRWVNRWLVIPVFDFLLRHISNMGIIILLLTIMVKIIILPLTYKSYLSMGKMRLLKPELDILNTKYPKQEDAMKKQQATMALYKDAGVSPMGGCIPMLIQFPILIALFQFFPTSIELRGQSFLWAEDLSTYDSILTLPFNLPLYGDHVSLFTLLMAVSLLISTRLNSKSQPTGPGAGSMKVITYLMPIMLLVMFNSYASGLTYYYFLSNLFTMGQQWIFKFAIDDEKLHARMKANAAKKTKTETKKKGKSKWQQRYDEMMKEQQKQIKQNSKKK